MLNFLLEIKWLLITSVNRAVVIYNGVDLTKFNPNRTGDLRNEFGFAPSTPVIGMIARLDPQKNPQTFVRAAAIVLKSIEEAKFICVGDGVFYPAIEQMVDELNITKSFILTGWRQDVPELLSTLDIFVIPSLWEGFPYVILEAMRAAKPVVVTDRGGTTEAVVHGDNGLVIKPGDPRALAIAVNALLHDPEEAAAMGRRGRERLNDFSLESMAQKTLEVYHRALHYRQGA